MSDQRDTIRRMNDINTTRKSRLNSHKRSLSMDYTRSNSDESRISLNLSINSVSPPESPVTPDRPSFGKKSYLHNQIDLNEITRKSSEYERRLNSKHYARAPPSKVLEFPDTDHFNYVFTRCKEADDIFSTPRSVQKELSFVLDPIERVSEEAEEEESEDDDAGIGWESNLFGLQHDNGSDNGLGHGFYQGLSLGFDHELDNDLVDKSMDLKTENMMQKTPPKTHTTPPKTHTTTPRSQAVTDQTTNDNDSISLIEILQSNINDTEAKQTPEIDLPPESYDILCNTQKKGLLNRAFKKIKSGLKY